MGGCASKPQADAQPSGTANQRASGNGVAGGSSKPAARGATRAGPAAPSLAPLHAPDKGPKVLPESFPAKSQANPLPPSESERERKEMAAKAQQANSAALVAAAAAVVAASAKAMSNSPAAVTPHPLPQASPAVVRRKSADEAAFAAAAADSSPAGPHASVQAGQSETDSPTPSTAAAGRGPPQTAGAAAAVAAQRASRMLNRQHSASADEAVLASALAAHAQHSASAPSIDAPSSDAAAQEQQDSSNHSRTGDGAAAAARHELPEATAAAADVQLHRLRDARKAGERAEEGVEAARGNPESLSRVRGGGEGALGSRKPQRLPTPPLNHLSGQQHLGSTASPARSGQAREIGKPGGVGGGLGTPGQSPQPSSAFSQSAAAGTPGSQSPGTANEGRFWETDANLAGAEASEGEGSLERTRTAPGSFAAAVAAGGLPSAGLAAGGGRVAGAAAAAGVGGGTASSASPSWLAKAPSVVIPRPTLPGSGPVTPNAFTPNSITPGRAAPLPKVPANAAPVKLMSFSTRELKEATGGFSTDNLLGEGGFGCVYRGSMKAKTVYGSGGDMQVPVAVKKLNEQGLQGQKEWLAEVRFLGDLRHENLVRLLGYASEGSRLYLVYEYMPNGSVEDLLFTAPAGFSWSLRMRVALGAAKGLAYLHDDQRVKQIIYRDFKTSNILLDQDQNAKLSDFGLARLAPVDGRSHVTTKVVGTQGYADPGYIMTGRLSVKSDVYSFGVVLLELLSGRYALDPYRPAEERVLVEWARPFLMDRRQLYKMIDPKLEGNYSVKGAQKCACLALNCVTLEAHQRPAMSNVVKTLAAIQDL